MGQLIVGNLSEIDPGIPTGSLGPELIIWPYVPGTLPTDGWTLDNMAWIVVGNNRITGPLPTPGVAGFARYDNYNFQNTSTYRVEVFIHSYSGNPTIRFGSTDEHTIVASGVLVTEITPTETGKISFQIDSDDALEFSAVSVREVLP